MEEIEHFTDDRHKTWCIHCGSPIIDRHTNRDHVPTKGLLERPLPPHVPQVEVCKVDWPQNRRQSLSSRQGPFKTLRTDASPATKAAPRLFRRQSHTLPPRPTMVRIGSSPFIAAS